MNKKIKILLLIISLLISTTYTTYGYVGIDGLRPMMIEGSILTKELAPVLEMECNTDVETEDKLTLTLKNGQWLKDSEVNESSFEKEFTRYNNELKIIKKDDDTIECSVSGLKENSKLKIPILCKGKKEGKISLEVTSEKKEKTYEEDCVASVHNGEIEGSVGGTGEFQGYEKHNISGVLYAESFGSLPKGKAQLTFELGNEFEFMNDGRIEYRHISNVKSDTKILDNKLIINLDFSNAKYERSDVLVKFEKISIEAKEGTKSQDVIAKLYIDGNQLEEDKVGKYKAEVKNETKVESKREKNDDSTKEKKKDIKIKEKSNNRKSSDSRKSKSIEEIIEEIREAARRESEFMKEIGEYKNKDKKESKSKKGNKSTESKSIEEIIREIQKAAREETEFMKEIGEYKKGYKGKSIEEIIEEIMEAAREETEFMKEIGMYKEGSKSEKNNTSTKSIEEIIREIQEAAREESRFMKEIEKEDNKPKKIFSDISSHWAKDYIEKLSDKNIISGVNNNEFNPEGYITRAQIAAILVNALDIDMDFYENNKVFKDVGTESWYSKFVSVSYRNNLISGFDGEFKPEKEISGEELIQIVVNAYEKKYGEIKIDLEDMKNINGVSDWAKVAVAKAKKIGAIDNVLDPIEYKGKVKRGQASALVYELIK